MFARRRMIRLLVGAGMAPPPAEKKSVDLRGNLFGLSDHSVLSGQVVRSEAMAEREHRHAP